MTLTGAGMPASEVWVFAVCDAGRMQFVRFFATEAAADTYARHWLAGEFGYTLTGNDDRDWYVLDRRCEDDESLSWLIVSSVEAATGAAPTEPDAAAPTDATDATELDDAVARAAIGVLAEADGLTDTYPALDQRRAITLIVQRLRDWAYLD
jgi:hypothetical protein